ncbi:MAG: hypothetical protein IJ731_08115, partial [Eubacterium sp.]|nr:hypothetical protein [Eubacterium sp.]
MKKMSKKITSVILAVLLAITSFPFVALADDATARIDDAILYYEQAMDGRIRVNMTAAYDAYVEANKARDAYKYGNVDVDLDAYADTLNAAVDNMTEWSYNGITSVTPYFGDDSGDNSAYANNGVGNILYWGSPLEGDGAKYTSGTIANVEIELWYPANTVLLLDGKKTPAMPVMSMAKKNTGKNRYVYQIYPCKSATDNSASPNFKMGTTADNSLWYGSNGNANRNKNWIWTIGRTSGTDTGRVKGEPGTNSTETALNMSRWGLTNYWASIANVLRFYGTQSEYSKAYTIDWYAVSGDEANDTRFMSPTMQVHVLNYKALLDTMQGTSKMAYLSVSENTYTQGGLRNVLAAYDQATAFNVNSYDYSNTSNVAAAASVIEAADTALKAATATTDSANYENLRKAINAKKSTYEAGAEGYTTESWATFAEAYENAVDVFENIQTTGYNDAAGAQDKADALNGAVLVPNVEKVDSTQLELAINEAETAIANSAMFTADSYSASNIEAVVSAAKIAIWGAEANYPNAKFKLDLSDESTALADAQFKLVRAAVYALRINKDTKVLTAGNNSMNEAVALSANYSSEDYGNYADLATAVNAANSFVVTVNALTDGCIENKIAEYKEKTRAVINAINLLRPAFDKITNGTFGSFTANDSTVIRSTGDGYENWVLTFKRNNNVVVFRTDYAPFTIDLGGASLEWYTKESFDAHLDSINVYDISEENKIGEIVSSGASFFWADPSATSLPDPENYPGMLSASTEENSTYVLKNLTVSSSAASKLGCDLEGNAITDTSFIFDEYLSATQGSNTETITGTVTTNKGSAYMNGDYTLAVPRESKRALTAETLPTLTEHTLSSNFGMVYYWKYTNTGIRWLGYSHDRVPYSQTTYVMNIAPLMELIEQCKAIQTDEQQYKLDSWNAFSAALSAARGNMDYGNMSAADIEAECQTRYTNLWNAYKSLEKAATNASIHTAVEADEAVGNTYKADNDDARWSANRWATFKAAYEAAASAIANGGTYSDVNVRNYGPEQQSAIDAVATALTTAYNELVQYGGRADFTA